MRLKMRWIVAALITIVAMAAAFTFYERTRPHLAERSQSDYLRDVRQIIGSLQGAERRAAVAAGREFLLDYPSADEPRLRLELAMLMADLPDADMESVANETERVALHVLSRVRPNRSPSQQDFQKMGFRFGKYGYGYGYGSWPTPFIVSDVDGDNQRDVLFSCPGGEYSYYGGTMQPGVCLLFRQTPQGWTKHRLGIGVPVIGLWTFDVTKNGPKAVVLANLADSAYRPNLFFDVFVWQGGRMNNVLSTKIPNGWQWEHRDVDGDGTQEIRVFGRWMPPRWWEENQQHVVTTYRWNDSRFVPQQTQRGQPTEDVSQWLVEGGKQFAAGRYRKAARAFQTALHWQDSKKENADSYFKQYGSRRAWYYLALCHAMLGEHAEAVQAMKQTNPRREEEQDTVSQFAQKFLDACKQPSDLPRAAAAVGQVFRVIEVAQQTSRPNASPKDVLTAAGYPPDFYQEIDLTGDGKPEAVTRFGWTGGGAVVAFQRDEQTKQWTTWLLAYAHKDKVPEWAYPLEVDELFYLPQVPTLQPYPVASDVKVNAVQSRGKYPQVVIEYQNADGKYQGDVQWNGERFVTTVPTSQGASGNLVGELNRIETYLFERKEFAETLTLLDAFARRVRRSSLPSEEKNDLLLEVYYHQAICYRKLGQTRKASVTLTALWRGQPKNVWGRLAKKWLRFTR